MNVKVFGLEAEGCSLLQVPFPGLIEARGVGSGRYRLHLLTVAV